MDYSMRFKKGKRKSAITFNATEYTTAPIHKALGIEGMALAKRRNTIGMKSSA
jgi:hypothetical protein